MDLSLPCIVSLSKKMRSMIGDGNATIILSINNLKGGRGDGKLSISCDTNMEIPEDLLKHETSIMLTPLEVKEELPSKSGVGNIFSTNTTKTSTRTAVDRLAATEAPSNAREIATAIHTAEEIEAPSIVPNKTTPEGKRYAGYIKNLQELITAVNEARSKTSGVDVDSIDDSTIAGKRQKAAALEMKEMEESIDQEAFVVNTKFASLVINDLGIQLGLNMPFDLSKISAKRIAMSRELRGLISDGSVEIISPQKALEMRRSYQPPETPGSLGTFSVDEAADRLFAGGVASEAQELRMSVNELDDTTEEQQLASLVRTQLPTRTGASGTVLSGGVRRTLHKASFGDDNNVAPVGGGGPLLADMAEELPHIENRVPDHAKVNAKGVKTIAKKR